LILFFMTHQSTRLDHPRLLALGAEHRTGRVVEAADVVEGLGQGARLAVD
jgi:hypothetical protein